jgi:hypothetical protein
LRADDAILGRILAGDYALFTLILAIASALAGVASEQLGVRAAITVFAVAAGAAATVYLVLTQRVRRSLQVTAAS